MNPTFHPTLHKPVPMNSRVFIPDYYIIDEISDNQRRLGGTVVGIANIHVIFTYIVLLDEPIQTEYGEFKAVVVNGAELEAEDGTNWRNK